MSLNEILWSHGLNMQERACRMNTRGRQAPWCQCHCFTVLTVHVQCIIVVSHMPRSFIVWKESHSFCRSRPLFLFDNAEQMRLLFTAFLFFSAETEPRAWGYFLPSLFRPINVSGKPRLLCFAQHRIHPIFSLRQWWNWIKMSLRINTKKKRDHVAASMLHCHQSDGAWGPSGGGGGGGFTVLCDVCRSEEDSEDESLSHGGRQNHDNLYRVHMPSLYSCGSSYGSETSIPAAAHTVSNAPVTEYM